jgi:hypothetical protein
VSTLSGKYSKILFQKEKALTIKIIGAGFGRTGTTSLKLALEILGLGPCYHMQEIVPLHPWRAKAWYKASQGQAVNWSRVFRGYQATVDWPGCYFYRELLEVYPEAKVILTVRDPERWYQSALNTIYPSANFSPLQKFIPITRYIPLMLHSVVWNGTFQGQFTDKAYALKVYKEHIETVKRIVPADQLLVYQLGEGWEPLCHFLNVPVPPTDPFPHLNDSAQFQRFIRGLQLARRLTLLATGGLLGMIMLQLLFGIG